MASPKVMELVELFETEADRDRPPAETPDGGIGMGSGSATGVSAGVNAVAHGSGTLAGNEGAK